jgi:hypothetical protein
MSVDDHMAHRLYPALDGRGLHSCVIVLRATSWSVPFPCFLSLSLIIIASSNPLAQRIRPSHELDVGVDASGTRNVEVFGTSSVVQGVLHAHENARAKREGIGEREGVGEAEREGRSRVQGGCGTARWRGADSLGCALPPAEVGGRRVLSSLVGRGSSQRFMAI